MRGNVPVFKKRGYPDSVVTIGKHRAQEIDQETALQNSHNEETDRIGHTYLPPTEPCYQKCHSQKLQNSPQ